jgi:alcohol dehydrogenase class IV
MSTISAMYFPRFLSIGGGSIREAPEALRQLDSWKPLIVTDPYLFQSGVAEGLRSSFAMKGIECSIFSDTVPDPTSVVVDHVLEVFRNGRHDCLVALGGGSPIDTAKAAGMLAANGGSSRDYKFPNLIPLSGPPLLAIPTTAGTGSEATKVAVITDVEQDEKMLIMSPHLLPVAAIIDFELTISMPFRLIADTGIDALTHAIEAYVSRKAHGFTDALALTAMRAIWRNIRTACFEPENRAAREAMMLAATQAGMAFSNSSVALVHGMSRPLGAFFHIAHGLSNAMLLPAVTAFSLPAAIPRYGDCARAMGIAGIDDDDAMASGKLGQEIHALNHELKVPSPKAYGISESAYFSTIPRMAQQALASGSPANNPRLATHGEIEQLYREVWA